MVVGAGLAGLIAAIRLNQLGRDLILIDASLPQAQGKLGGFAKFSGAKFSLPPAGMGLLSVTKTEEALWEAIQSVSDILGLDFDRAERSQDRGVNVDSLRGYDSLLLTPDEIDALIANLTGSLQSRDVPILKGQCTEIINDGENNSVLVEVSGKVLSIDCKAVFYAGGRLGEDSLINCGVTPTDVKGLDLGVRVEFPNNGLAGLRGYGPDAKIIKGRCRTFCLNVPGEIYRYPYKSISVPGGIVASDEVAMSNVGLLYRSEQKIELLDRVIKVGETLPKEILEKPFLAKSSIFGESEPLLKQLYGESVTGDLHEFGEYLGEQGLVDWEEEHFVHLPLIDWHWNTFSQEGTFRTNKKSIYCLGDSSGHARGLLQAAISGWLAAEEYGYEQ